MAEHAPFNNFTNDTVRKIYQLTYELLANQIANPYGVEVKVTATISDKKETASAQEAYIILFLQRKEVNNMLKPIIPIERASEELIVALINAGVLEVTEDGLKCKENRPNTPQEAKWVYQ